MLPSGRNKMPRALKELIVEVAEDPESALCDAAQQLHARDFAEFAAVLAAHAALLGRALA